MGKNKAAAWRLLVIPTDAVVPSGLLCSVMDPSTFAGGDFNSPSNSDRLPAAFTAEEGLLVQTPVACSTEDSLL